MATTAAAPVAPSAVVQRLDQLKKHVDSLTTRATRAQVQLETARQQYKEAEAEAVRDFGTSELGALRAKLVSAEAENARVVKDFETAVEGFESFLVRIESALADPEVMAELVDAISTQAAAARPVAQPGNTATFAAEDI